MTPGAGARELERDRPGLVEFVLDRLRGLYGQPEWAPRRSPTEELVLTILSQHTSDLNAERAFDELTARFPDWHSVAGADVDDVAAAIASGGLARQKAPRIQAALRRIRAERGDFDLGFLAEMDPREARDWLVRFDGIGPKTASVVLLFCFGQPLMPVDTHVHRVTRQNRPHPGRDAGRPRPRRRPGRLPGRADVRGAREPDHARSPDLHGAQPCLRPVPGGAALPVRRSGRAVTRPAYHRSDPVAVRTGGDT